MKITKRFEKYVEEKNFWPKLTGKGTLITFPLSAEDVKFLADSLSSDLSPENLHCDGEISVKAAGVKYRKLKGVEKDLKAYAKKFKFPEPIIYS